MRKNLLCAVAMLTAPLLWAVKHPVTLDPKTDSAKCVECHADKAKGKTTHAAVAMGCNNCHEIKTYADSTNVKLVTRNIAAMCFKCHEDKKPASAKGRLHEPAAKDCTRCHTPHASETPHLLLKATAGGKDENLCLSCHNNGQNTPEKGSRHAALDMGCDTCHVTHKTGERGNAEFDFHLAKAVPALCIDCHDVKTKELSTAHNGQPFQGANCISCHDAHSSAVGKLAARNQHPPFGDRACDTCHAPAANNKVVLNQPEQKALCATCHDEIAKSIAAAKVQHPGAAGDCTACHNAHASQFPRMMQASQTQVCGSCHEKTNDPVQHGPFGAGQCSVCHSLHGGNLPKLLRTGSVQLCYGCHVDAEKVQRDEKERTVTLPWGAVLPIADYDKIPKLALDKNGAGHPLLKHPVSGKDSKGKEINCLSCHQPHSSALPKLLPAGLKQDTQLCSACHAAMGF